MLPVLHPKNCSIVFPLCRMDGPTSLVAQLVKNLPAMRETWVRFLGWEDPLEKEMATQSSILAWKIPWTEEPGGLQSMGSQRIAQDRATKDSAGWMASYVSQCSVFLCFPVLCLGSKIWLWISDVRSSQSIEEDEIQWQLPANRRESSFFTILYTEISNSTVFLSLIKVVCFSIFRKCRGK